MNLFESIQNHQDVCEDVYRLMLDWNRTLKAGTASSEDAAIVAQRSMIRVLDISLARVRRCSEASGPLSAEERVAVERCQRTVMKALLLDRENEQLLLKSAMLRPPAPVAPKPNQQHLARLYARH
jgi:hypothetical protein